MMASKNAGNLPEDRAQEINTTATAAAARITSAYSAIVCPASSDSRWRARTQRARTYQDKSIPVHPLSGDRTDGGQQDWDHRQEEERGEDEEHEREEHLHGRRSSALGGRRAPDLAYVGGEMPDLLGQRRPERVGPRERAEQPMEVGEREAVAHGAQLVAPPPAEVAGIEPPAELVGQGPRGGLDGATEGELGREPRRRRDRQQVQQHRDLAVGRGERSAGEA